MIRLYTFAVEEDDTDGPDYFDIERARELVGNGTAELYSDQVIES